MQFTFQKDWGVSSAISLLAIAVTSRSQNPRCGQAASFRSMACSRMVHGALVSSACSGSIAPLSAASRLYKLGPAHRRCLREGYRLRLWCEVRLILIQDSSWSGLVNFGQAHRLTVVFILIAVHEVLLAGRMLLPSRGLGRRADAAQVH